MKLSIQEQGQRRSTSGAPLVLGLVGMSLARLLGVHRISLRVQRTPAEPRAELVIVRGRTASAYRLRGRLLRWTQAASTRLADRWLTGPTPATPRP